MNQVLLDIERQDITLFTGEKLKRVLQEMNNTKSPGYNRFKYETFKSSLEKCQEQRPSFAQRLQEKENFLIMKVFIKIQDKDPNRVNSFLQACDTVPVGRKDN